MKLGRRAVILIALTMCYIVAGVYAVVLSNVWTKTIPLTGGVGISDYSMLETFYPGSKNNVTLEVENLAGEDYESCGFYINITVPGGFDSTKLSLVENSTGTYLALSIAQIDTGVYQGSFGLTIGPTYHENIDINFVFDAGQQTGDYKVDCWIEEGTPT